MNATKNATENAATSSKTIFTSSMTICIGANEHGVEGEGVGEEDTNMVVGETDSDATQEMSSDEGSGDDE
jgi:hypothetical protein